MADELSGSAIISAVKASGVEFIVALPDITTSAGLLFPIAADPSLRLVRVCKEDEAIGIAAGMSYADQRALVLFQHTGLLDSINAVRAVPVEYNLPVCMMVGLLNKEPGVPPAQSSVYNVRIVPGILDTMGVRYIVLETTDDVKQVPPAIDRAYAKSETVVMLIGRRPS
jgi:sulfopyruvate decarboxylase TPP-binding subunit